MKQDLKNHAILKNNKFETKEIMTKESITFQPILNLTSYYTYNIMHVTFECLEPLCQNKYTFANTHPCSHFIKCLYHIYYILYIHLVDHICIVYKHFSITFFPIFNI